MKLHCDHHRYHHRLRTPPRRVFVWVVLILAAIPATAQVAGDERAAESARTIPIRVYDRDLDIPLEGVTIVEASTGARVTTDRDGRAVIAERFPAPRAVLDLSLPGYEPVRTMVTEFDTRIDVPMVILGILEAEELVIVADRIGRTDDTAGVSVVVEREFIKSSAMIGVIEDVMSTVKLLPGVSYAGGFNSFLSVRGGEPDGLTHVLDGLVVKYPYHWGGGVSVFNPHVVDTVRLSAGIFPVRYGQATSGLMEVSSIDPTQGLRWEVAQSTSTLEGYAQVPLGRHTGLFAGARFTNYDLVFAMTGQFLEEQGVTFSRVPYIYAGYLRLLGRPNPATEWFVNALLGTDGIGLAAIQPDIDESEAIRNTFDFAWENADSLTGAGINRLVGDRLLLSGIVGYEWVRNTVDGRFTERGTRVYSDTFVSEVQTNPDFAAYRPYVAPGGSFTIDQPTRFLNSNILHHLQLRLDGDYQIDDRTVVQAGLGAFLQFNEYVADAQFWTVDEDPESGEFTNRRFTVDQSTPNNRGVTSFGYANLERDLVPDRLSADLGLRIDHAALSGAGFTVNTVPALGPRALLHWTPAGPRDRRGIDELTLTGGAGVFTKVPFDAALINEDLDIDGGQLTAPKSFMALLGGEARFSGGWRFKIEGYYKHLYDRFYINFVEERQDDGSLEGVPRVYTDGIGHVGGFDLVLDRRTSRWFDGMVAYSFIHARYLNPTGDGGDGSAAEPRGRWYYPPFHRFHTLNALVNVKPLDWLTLTTTVTFSTGQLAPSYGEKEIVPLFIADGAGGLDVAETYERDQFYSNTNREGWVLPVDIRLSFHWYPEDSKVYREFYIGGEDVLAVLVNEIAPSSDAVTTDRYTGEDTRAAEQNASFPIVSIGFRMSY